MKHHKLKRGRTRMSGISMIESLVALVVISVGMLGIASLYLASLKAGRTANLRIQAVNLVADMTDRIRANKRGQADYNSVSYGGAPGAYACISDVLGCTPAEIAENDLNAWFTSIDDALRNLGATGTVGYVAPGAAPAMHRYLVAVNWREAGEDTDFSYSVLVELEQ